MVDATGGASMPDGTDRSSGANIISFPGRLRPPVDAAARLRQAIRDLHQANSELRDKVADWRAATKELAVSLGEIAKTTHVADTKLTAAASQLQRSDAKEPENSL